MNKFLKKILAGVACAGICLSVSACGSKADSSKTDSGEEKTDVRIAYFPNITHTQALVMKNQKTLEEK